MANEGSVLKGGSKVASILQILFKNSVAKAVSQNLPHYREMVVNYCEVWVRLLRYTCIVKNLVWP